MSKDKSFHFTFFVFPSTVFRRRHRHIHDKYNFFSSQFHEIKHQFGILHSFFYFFATKKVENMKKIFVISREINEQTVFRDIKQRLLVTV